MADGPLVMTDASVYWGSGATTPVRVLETRNVTIDMGSDFAETTVHGDKNRTFEPTFANWAASITGLWNRTVGQSTPNDIESAARNKISGKFSIYKGDVSHYEYGSGFVSVDEIGMPYDDVGTFNWSIRSTGEVGQYGI